MRNIISADFYRVKKGGSLQWVLIGLAILFFFMAGMFWLVNNADFYKWAAQTESASNGMIRVDVTTDSGEYFEDQSGEMAAFLSNNGAEFIILMLEEVSNCLPLLLLPFIMAVFGADYQAGTFRNLLSYETNRTRVYIAKLIVTALYTGLMLLGYLVLSGIVGCLFYGFGGFTGAFFGKLCTIMVLQLPVYLACICLGFFIQTLFKRNSYTISTYIAGMFVWTLVIQILAMAIPRFSWLIQLDMMSSLMLLAKYELIGGRDIAVTMVFSLAVLVVTLCLGISRYKKTDFDFA